MTFDELKAAYAAGATIQISTEEWIDLEAPHFNSSLNRYRIKPKEVKPKEEKPE